MRSLHVIWSRVVLTGIALMIWTAVGQAQTPSATAERKPGLAVCYIYAFVRHIDEFAELEQKEECKPGEPLAVLDSRVGLNKVLTSRADDGVLAKITGYIHLDKAGAYKFAFESNDGVRLTVDGEMIVEDPDVHSDRYSEVGSMEVGKPGWYPLAIDYFERKNTSTLRFYWRPPGVEGDFLLVPAEALTH